MTFYFEWDRKKARTNARKHGVTFEEAQTVFADPTAVVFYDECHSDDELRDIAIGHSVAGRLLLVSFTEREGVYRIISARKADRRERKRYEEETI
jgi:uncharacterized DUF497 family protein